MVSRIKQVIEDDKKTFYKRLYREIWDSRVETFHLPNLEPDTRAHFCVNCIVGDGITNYKALNEVLAIYRVLRRYYGLNRAMAPETIVKLCKTIARTHGPKYWAIYRKRYIKNPKMRPKLDTKEAFRELVSRGFIPNSSVVLKKTLDRKKDWYMKADLFNMVHPEAKITDDYSGQIMQSYIGLEGYVGYNDPNRG